MSDESPGSDGRFEIGIDIGGTHTDLVVDDRSARGRTATFKVPTTPDDLMDGVLSAIDAAADGFGASRSEFLDATGVIVHGTTVTTNALIEGEAATTGLLTTEGFRDVMERNMESSPDVYDLRREPSLALVPRYLRREVPERLDSDGNTLEGLDEEATERAVERLVDEGAEAVGVALLSSYADDRHERRVCEIARDVEGIEAVSGSTAVYPRIGIHDRSITAVVDASLKPIIRSYLTELESRLDDAGFRGTLLLMQGNGGISAAHLVAERPIASVNSGPAGGAVSAAGYATRFGSGRVISFEMGGTSSDVCLISGGEPLVGTDNAVGETPIPLPMVDVNTIGAGGGSIAWIDERGVLQVGPKSAGSDPGPICYDRGGEEPTLTDANLVLGYLNPTYFLGGKLSIDLDAARAGIQEHIADPLGLSVREAAAGIRSLAIEEIVNQVRQVTIAKGYDPRDFTLIGGGGAGPLHVATLAERFDTRALAPREAGTFSSMGLLEADVKHDLTRSVVAPLSASLPDELRTTFAEMEESAGEILESEGIPREKWAFDRSLDTRYEGQVHEITIPFEEGDDRDAIEARHHDQHEQQFAFSDEDGSIEVVNAKLTALAETGTVGRERAEEGIDPADAIKGRRDVYFPSTDTAVETAIYDGTEPFRGPLDAPSVVELPHTTILVPPEFDARTDTSGNIVLEP